MKTTWWGMGLLVGLPAAAIGLIAGLAALRTTRRQQPDPPASPGDHGLPFEEVAFLTVDGITIRGWFIPVGPSAGRGTILLCSGHSGSMDSDLKYVPPLHAEGYHVLMFDFRGHGRSGGTRVSLGYYERLDIQAALDFLGRKGCEAVGLLGFSMGGATAMSAAALAPIGPIRAVVSDGGFASASAMFTQGLRQWGLPRPLAVASAWLAVRLIDAGLGCKLDDVAPVRVVGRIAPRGLFLIHGEEDAFVPLPDVRRLYDAAGEPKRLWVQSGAGHRQVDQMAPTAYWSQILEFLDPFFPRERQTTSPGDVLDRRDGADQTKEERG